MTLWRKDVAKFIDDGRFVQYKLYDVHDGGESMNALSPGEREFVDRMGLCMEKFGASRTMGRVYGWLMICDPPDQSMTEMASTLEVSKTSISTVVRLLHDAGMVERYPAPNREHHYQITSGGWSQVLRVQMASARGAIEAAEFGLSILATERIAQQERLAEFRDLFQFQEQETEEFIRRWEQYRKKKRTGCL
ncbi:MarR family transcriptional regulator [Saccharopolyspora sp. K220]|uniref:GbsR/MarR family transcriptional regulator n=1 Tax=Saccharopolyspora soli TaxID=2926618 RepID=UPI001F58FC56|nr:MarR family transcriptional regulator [Saccharopolyspora soli]MCI2416810.1 MarR family transcriptional regulator [Saccharopolyspora soli]